MFVPTLENSPRDSILLIVEVQPEVFMSENFIE